jgi:hypothetical protein
MANLLLTVMDLMGIPLEGIIGNSTGQLDLLSVA